MTPNPTPAGAEAATRSRRNYTQQEKAEHVALFKQSGMSQADYCREFSLNEATFSLWHRSARGENGPADGAPRFAEVLLNIPKLDAPTTILHLPSGARLEVTTTDDATWQGLGLLLKTLHS